jgi:hypothetical protein
LRIETTFVMISFVCFVFSIYFVMLSLYVTVDELLRQQLLATSTSFFVGGAVIAVLLTVLKIVGKLSSKTKKATTEYTHP